jgi:hypothetical protein
MALTSWRCYYSTGKAKRVLSKNSMGKNPEPGALDSVDNSRDTVASILLCVRGRAFGAVRVGTLVGMSGIQSSL